MVSATSVWPPRIAALVVSIVAALSVAYWGLHWRLPSSPVLAATSSSASDQPVDSNAVAKALGATAAAKDATPLAPQATEASRFVLQGVAGNASSGSALIAIDGKPPKPVRVGDAVIEGWTLRLVEGRRAVLSRNGTDLELALPALPQPATLSKKTP
ncbi:MAG: general secretion pathway protein C [Betaproteobacteria bacterium]|nr:general secretion pathway protein C [Betaproteobacteria bacterium]